MKSTLVAAGTLCLFSMGCGHSLMQPPTSFAEGSVEPVAEPSGAGSADDAQLGDFLTSRAEAYDYLYAFRTAPRVVPRVAGDYVVYRFTGSELERPVTLTERVVGRRGSLLIVDQILEDGGEPVHLRLRIRDETAGMNRIVSVARVVEGVQLPFGTLTYEALMDRVLPPLEATEAKLASARESVEVRGTRIDCEKTAYRVRVGGEPAFMTVLQSPHFAWGDIGGEIRDGHGRLLYKAEIVELSGMHTAAAEAPAALAQAQADPYEGLDDGDAATGTTQVRPSSPGGPIAAQADLESYDDWDELE